LKEVGYEVEDVSNGPEALEKYILYHHHDAVVLDLLMQGMHGADVLQKLMQLNPQLPVIIVR
jgi:CheY-like chemotaxis protein